MSFTEAHLGDLAAALVDDQLDQSTRNHVLLHLGRCPGCRSDVEEQRQLKQRLHALGVPGLPTGLMARLGALSRPLGGPEDGRPEPLVGAPDLLTTSRVALTNTMPQPLTHPLAPTLQPARRTSMLRHQQRGRRMLVGAASLLLVGAGTAVAAGGHAQSGPAGTSSPSTSTFSTSFSSPLAESRGTSPGSSLPLTDPAFDTMTASFTR